MPGSCNAPKDAAAAAAAFVFASTSTPCLHKLTSRPSLGHDTGLKLKMAEKGAPAHITLSKQDPAPPSYAANSCDLNAAFSNLRLDISSTIPTANQCKAHLKLLEAFNRLRVDIGSNNGLYGLSNELAAGIPSNTRPQVLMKICEKRWAVYVTRAASRFERWWNVSVERGSRMLQQADLASPGSFASIASEGGPLAFTKDTLPPLGKLFPSFD